MTGAAGFVGSHCVLQLLERGYHVRACVRDASDDAKVSFLKATPAFASGQLTVHSCDMSVAGVFDAIFAECDALIHTADGGYPSVTSGAEYMTANKRILASIEASPTMKRLICPSPPATPAAPTLLPPRQPAGQPAGQPSSQPARWQSPRAGCCSLTLALSKRRYLQRRGDAGRQPRAAGSQPNR